MGISHFLKRFVIFGNLLLIFLLFNSSVVNSQEKGELKLKSPIISDTTNGTKVSNEQDGGARFDSNSVENTQEKKEKKSENSNETIEKDFGQSNVSESLLQSNEGDDQKKIKKDSGKNVDVKNKDGDNEPRKNDVNEKSNGSLMGLEKSKVRDDECDPSNMCVDEKKNLTACLRVPGNDSPDLSLLIRNKGSKPITVTITAPEYVQLEETKVHLEQKEDKKVRVSVAYEGKDSLISLVTEDSRCTLDFKEMIPHDSRIETRYTFKFKIFYNSTKNHGIIFLTLLAFVVFGSIWMCSGLYKKFYPGNGYETIETELPITGVSKICQESNDGWDDTWDDHWDDEEAPKTPALPATPNLSSRGLASGRLFKDGWKD